jgi:transcriptional regulator with XRE-family HTH domain
LAAPGVSYAYISRIERGDRVASVKALRLIATKLGTTPDYLETGRKVVMTLTLKDYEQFLLSVELDPRKLTHEDIDRLRQFTHEAFKRFPERNPLAAAAQILKEDIEIRKDPARLVGLTAPPD